MNGQAKALIPALIGIIPLLLTGISGCDSAPGEQQAIKIAETRAVTIEQHRREELGTTFRAEANAAAIETGQNIAADLAVELKLNSSRKVAANTRELQQQRDL